MTNPGPDYPRSSYAPRSPVVGWTGAVGTGRRVGPLEVWLNLYDKKWRRQETSALPLPIFAPPEADEWKRVHRSVQESGLLDFEIEVSHTGSVPEGHHLVIAIGHRLTPSHLSELIGRSTCIVLDRYVTQGRCVWRTRGMSPKSKSDAESFLAAHWRPARTWATLLVAREVRRRLPGSKNKKVVIEPRAVVVHPPGTPLQWRLELGTADDYQARTFQQIAVDLLKLVVPRQVKGFETSDVDLERELGAGADLHAVLNAYRVAHTAQEFADQARPFFRSREATAPIRHEMVSVPAQSAAKYWAENGDVHPTQIARTTVLGGRPYPTQFLALRLHRLDPDLAVAVASARRVLRHVSQALNRLRVVRDREIASDANEPTKRFIETPRAQLTRSRAALIRDLRRVGVSSETDDTSAPLEQTTKVSARVAVLRRLALRADPGLRPGDTSVAALHLEATNKVYEDWSFVRVALALESLGFYERPGTPLRPHALYYAPAGASWTLQHGASPALKLVLHKEPTLLPPTHTDEAFGLEDRYEDGLTNRRPSGPPNGRQVTPDIVLEVHGAPAPRHIPTGVPQLLVFDASSSDREDQWRGKYKYYDLIRAFTGRTAGGALIRRDPRTGESPRIVRAAWCICPGTKRKDSHPDPKGGAVFEMGTEAPRDARLRHGYYVLTAREAGSGYATLASWLMALLVGLDILPPLALKGSSAPLPAAPDLQTGRPHLGPPPR